jgi:hypothetical protein
MNEQLFLPMIQGDIDGDDKRALRRDLSIKIELALHREDCARAIAKYKCNGVVLGHKILDNDAALDELIDAAPKEIGESIDKSPLLRYEKLRVLDQVLRKEFVIDKFGKIDGTLSKRAQQRLERRSPSAE